MTYFLGTQSQITCRGFTDATNTIFVESAAIYIRLSYIYFHRNPTIDLKQNVKETKAYAQNWYTNASHT